MNWLRGKMTTTRPVSCQRLRWSARILMLSIFISCGLVFRTVAASFVWNQDSPIFKSRRLLSEVAWEKCDLEIEHARNYTDRDSWHAPNIAYVWLALYIFCVLVIFLALAIVCDDFFVPSLEAISEKLELSEDVAGATFMAAGSSAPELFTSVAGVTVESDVGIGTIVGSALFNLLVIIALTAALAGKVLQLDWRPLFRDSTCYAISIGMFIWFAWDGKFYLHEAVILLILYILYIILMKFNSKLMDLLARIGPKATQVSPQATEVMQFVSSDIESLVETNGVLQGQHGTPAGKLPPLKPSGTKVPDDRSHTYLQPGQTGTEAQQGPPGQAKLFSHAHKGELSRSFNNLSLGKSQQPYYLPRLSMSYPILRECPNDDPKAHRRSSLGFSHGHAGADRIRLKSVAQQQVMKEYRRRSELAQQEKEHQARQQRQQHVTVLQVDANGNATAIPPDADPESMAKEDETREDADNDEDEESKMVVCPFLPAISAEVPQYPEGGRRCISTIKYILGWILFVLSFPFFCMFTWTIPDCSKKHNRKYFLLSFLMSIVWIAILSFAMVTLVGRSGCILSIDKFTMGLVVVAIGTSVPDALSSILVARDGFGDMAVSNAIGSNVFDINLGIGLPFVIRILIDKLEPIHLLSAEEQALVDSKELLVVPHVKFGFILMLVLVIAMLIFIACRFQLKRKVGVSFFIIYVLFVLYAYIQDVYCDHRC